MGRRSHSQTLTLWANGEHVGRWTLTARGDMELEYASTWLASPRGRPISLSLPFNLNNEVLRGEPVAHYFEGLLPDSDAIRRRVATLATGERDGVHEPPVRTAPQLHRGPDPVGTQRHGDLPGPGRQPRLRRRLQLSHALRGPTSAQGAKAIRPAVVLAR